MYAIRLTDCADTASLHSHKNSNAYAFSNLKKKMYNNYEKLTDAIGTESIIKVYIPVLQNFKNFICSCSSKELRKLMGSESVMLFLL